MVILTSRADLPLPEVVRRHRGKQGQENAQKGPLTELGLHHPQCKSYVADQAFYPCGQIAQWLLELVPIFRTFDQGQLVASLNLATLGLELALLSASRADLHPISGCFRPLWQFLA